jgi:hypothetical protein
MAERLVNTNSSPCEYCLGGSSDCPLTGGLRDQAIDSHPQQPWNTESWNGYVDENVKTAKEEGCLRVTDVQELSDAVRNRIPPIPADALPSIPDGMTT